MIGDGFVLRAVHVAQIVDPGKPPRRVVEPSHHVRPREQDADCHALLRRVLRVPVVNRHRIARLFVVVRQNRRELFQRQPHGQLFPAVVVPRLGIERVVVACAHWVVEVPRRRLPRIRLARIEHRGHALVCPFRFLVHAELVERQRLIFVHTGLHMPAGEVAAIRARKSSRAKAAHGRALPVTVINVTRIECRLLFSGILKRLAQRPLPRRRRNVLIRAQSFRGHKNARQRQNARMDADGSQSSHGFPLKRMILRLRISLFLSVAASRKSAAHSTTPRK